MVELKCVTFREKPPKGLRGSRVRVMTTEVLTGPESSRVCGDGVEGLAWLLVMALSGVVVSLIRCFNVSFSEIQKSKSLNRRRKVFQSLKTNKIFSISLWQGKYQVLLYQCAFKLHRPSTSVYNRLTVSKRDLQYGSKR